MQAICYESGRVYLNAGAEAPEAGPDEAVIRLRRALVSGFDVAPTAEAPRILGHQFTGIVEAVHAQADQSLRKRWVGRRVVGSIDIVCMRCDLCRAGLAAHCRERRVLGMSGWDGCFAELFRLPLRNLVEVPGGVDDHAAVFAHMLSGALHAAQLARVEGKPYVTILGDSAEALLCAQVMARLNASVRLLGKRQFSLCERWGIKHRHVGEVGRRHDQDIVFDCTGGPGEEAGWGFALAVHLVRPRGRIVVRPGGGSARDARDALAAVVEHELHVLGARYGSIADASAMLARGEIDTAPLVTRRVRLGDGPAALRYAADADQIAVIVEP